MPTFLKRIAINMVAASILALSASMATAQEEMPDIPAMLAGLDEVTSSLQDRLNAMPSMIEASKKSAAEGAALLDTVLEAAREVVGQVDAESEFWNDINELLVIWADKRDDLTARGQINQALLPLADEWQARIDRATALRTMLIDQSATGQALINDLEQNREVILALYDLGQADRVLQEMEAMSEGLASMNETMSEIMVASQETLDPSGEFVPGQ